MSDFKDYYGRMMSRQKGPNGESYTRPNMDPDLVPTDQIDTFYNTRTKEYIKVPPIGDELNIMGLIPLLGGQKPPQGRQ